MAAANVTRRARLLTFFQNYGLNTAGVICLVGCVARLLANDGTQLSPREISSSLLFAASCVGMIVNKLTLGMRAGCVLGVLGHLATLWPGLSNAEPAAYMAMMTNTGLNGMLFFNNGLEGKYEKSTNRVLRITLGKPNLFYGLGLMFLTYLPGAINALSPYRKSQLVLYGIFALGAVSICVSKPKHAEIPAITVNKDTRSSIIGPKKAASSCTL
ncbi:MAG: hypothetical protein PHY92_00700 [Alphaproteobacteria bacterium]|nr:hypothetical protein [Alphaproteobacteria bacterium]